jgi:hypothetical protein
MARTVWLTLAGLLPGTWVRVTPPDGDHGAAGGGVVRVT